MKKFIYLIIFTALISQPVFAQKLPLKITPVQIISTHKDQIQVGDWIEFEAAYDVYKNDKLYVAKGTPVIAVVDHVHENGWVTDNAEITFKTFYTKDVSGKKIEFESLFKLNQRMLVKKDMKELLKTEIPAVIRGSEIFIEPDTHTFNVFLTD